MCPFTIRHLRNMSSDEVFEAISHPMRIDILKALAREPMRFADLKRKLRISSSGLLDFHLKKMQPIVTSNQDGLYSLNQTGYAAVYAVEVVSRKGRQKRSLYINLLAYIAMNTYVWFTMPEFFLILLVPTSAWIIFYAYWSFTKRGVRLRENNAHNDGQEAARE
jgi:DNA-binding transcriptional ArsR family regulator